MNDSLGNRFSLFLKIILITLVLFFVANITTKAFHPYMVWLLNALFSLPPLSMLVVPLILPFGLDVILLFPLHYLIYELLLRALRLVNLKRKLVFTILVAYLLVILSTTLSFRTSISKGDEYFTESYNTYMKEREEIVGTSDAEISFIDAKPTYSSAGELESIIATFNVKLQKPGDYQITSKLYAKDVLDFEYIDKDLTISGKNTFRYEEVEDYKEVKVVFEYNELSSNNYTGPFALRVGGLWRVGTELEELFGEGTQDAVRVNFVDPGTFIVGPYPLTLE